MKPNEDSKILLTLPAEIWRCNIIVNKQNPNAEAEALVLESVHAAGNLATWDKKMGVAPPYRTLSALTSRGLLNLSSTGDFEIPEEALEHMQKGDLIEFLNAQQGQEFSFWVVRDILTGNYHHRRIISENLDLKKGALGINAEAAVPKREHENLDRLILRDVLRPICKSIAYSFNIPARDVYSASRLIEVESEETTIDIEYRWHRRTDGTMIPMTVREEHRDLGSIIVNKRLIPELQAYRPESETKREWTCSPEIKAMARMDVAKKMFRRVQKSHTRADRDYLDSLLDEAIQATEATLEELVNNPGSRIESVQNVVGTEFDQWNAVQAVMHSAQSKCVLLSAFTHPEFADEAASRISDALQEKCGLLLLSGEPDRIHETGFTERTIAYEKALRKQDVPEGLEVECTKRASHAKFAISDSGMVWIGSCNLLSAAPGSWVLETGLLIDDSEVSSAIIDHIIEEGWLSTKAEEWVSEIRDALPKKSARNPKKKGLSQIKRLIKKLRDAKAHPNVKGYTNDVMRYGSGLINELGRIAEYPQWSLIRTEQHRPLLLSMVRESRKRIMIGTDAIRSGGLDKSTIEEISCRPAATPNRATKFTVQVFWGRQDPDYNRDNEELKDAASRLDLLRKKVNQYDDKGEGLRSLFIPFKSNDPMMNHAKFLATDEERMLITSDNLLSFADDEGWDSDARELGLLLDHPRLTRMLRAEMDLLVEIGRDHYDRARWHGAFARAIDDLGEEQTSFDNLMATFSDRIKSNHELSRDWFRAVESISNQYRIKPAAAPYAILREGAKDGFYRLKWIAEQRTILDNQRPLNIEFNDPILKHLTIINLTLVGSDACWKRPNELEETSVKQSLNDIPQQSSSISPLKSSIDPEAFSKALLEHMTNQDISVDFAGLYGNLIRNRPQYKIKKAAKFLSNCDKWIETTKSETGHPLIRRRQG